MTGKLEITMPANLEAERAILGAILLDTSGMCYQQAIMGLRSDSFSLDSHRRIFSSMVELMESGQAVDFVTLTSQLGQHKEIDCVGGTAYVMGLTDGLPRVKNIGNYVNIVADKSLLRETINLCESTMRVAYEQQDSGKRVLEYLNDDLLRIQANTLKSTAVKIADFSSETLGIVLERRNTQNRLIGFSTGLDSVDNSTTGIRRKELWTIGGRTGDGKTSLALQIASANASQGIPVVYFSLEMDRDSLLERIWSSFGRIDYRKISTGRFESDHELNHLAIVKEEVDKWPLYIEDGEAYSISEITARARLLIKREKVAVVIVDYVQIVDAPGKDERMRVTKISKALRMLAKSESVGVVALSQMPRPEKNNMNKRPTKFDLKESGSLENDSNTVLLIYRPVDEVNQYTYLDEIIIGKQRRGETGIERVVYLGKNMRFAERA